ncbi:MAG: prepilin-type N-terminal cleavage/methylation domain-containing protein [Deltaproteobacteria bacterium]|nr:prepilin-type N-terminal cleavage/methylation domain-containing protein [Deltaproteobacteria bacterium]
MKKHARDGYTLLEILVATAITGVVMGSIYTSFYSQDKSYVTQSEVITMQQNLRGGMSLMMKEIRMAGCDPTGKANAGIVRVSPNLVSFTLDIRGEDANDPPDGDTSDPNERITYALYDSNRDGVNDTLGRRTGAGRNTPAAENMDGLNFVYLDENGTPTNVLSEIRSVEVTLLARTARGDPKYWDNTIYANQRGAVIYAANDNFRRQMLTANIKCRNMWY